MLIAYATRTGNVRRFVSKLGMEAVQVSSELSLDEPFVFVTYTTGFGQVPEQAYEFLERHVHYLRGVAASGNRNWGHNFARSADLIAEQFGVPIVSKFELSGTARDVEHFKQGVKRIAAH